MEMVLLYLHSRQLQLLVGPQRPFASRCAVGSRETYRCDDEIGRPLTIA